MGILPDRPEPIYLKHEPGKIRQDSNREAALHQLLNGKEVLVADQFSTGLNLLSDLKKRVLSNNKDENFEDYRDQRRKYQILSNQILVKVSNGTISLEKSPEIGWLKRLYPDHDDFYLTFPQIQGLNSSWQWYLKGIQYPVLDEKIYPFYGTYFPTRSDHLRLFEKYLRREDPSGKFAMDIGTGCGVLSFQMLKYGISNVLSSDINPNAVITVRENIERMGIQSERIDVIESDLFEQISGTADLIVFNPPWLPKREGNDGLDLAIYYPENLFDRFFRGAQAHLNKDGKLVILFSNLASVETEGAEHPVINELALNRRFRKSKLIKHKADPKSKKTKRRDHRRNEYLELWELIPIDS